jgi:hypothetical protein
VVHYVHGGTMLVDANGLGIEQKERGEVLVAVTSRPQTSGHALRPPHMPQGCHHVLDLQGDRCLQRCALTPGVHDTTTQNRCWDMLLGMIIKPAQVSRFGTKFHPSAGNHLTHKTVICRSPANRWGHDLLVTVPRHEDGQSEQTLILRDVTQFRMSGFWLRRV